VSIFRLYPINLIGFHLGNWSLSKKPDIICVGDSLTVGYQSPTPNQPGYREASYGKFLQNQIGPNPYIVICSLNGEVAAEMVHRFKKHVLERSRRYVIILGGTNELGLNRCPSEIFKGLATMYDQAKTVSIIPKL
jgi:acyl-CoA thioesterase-1